MFENLKFWDEHDSWVSVVVLLLAVELLTLAYVKSKEKCVGCTNVWEDQTEELFHLCSGCSPAALICWPQANVTVFLIHVVAQDLDLVTSLVKGNLQCQQDSKPGEVSNDRMPSSAVKKEGLDLDLDLELENDHHDGDSFFDDPLPKPQKTYGWWGCVTSHWPSLSVVSCLIVIGPVWLHPYSVSL